MTGTSVKTNGNWMFNMKGQKPQPQDTKGKQQFTSARIAVDAYIKAHVSKAITVKSQWNSATKHCMFQKG